MERASRGRHWEGPGHRQDWLTCVEEAWGPPVRVAGGRRPGKGSEEGAGAAPCAGPVVAAGFFFSIGAGGGGVLCACVAQEKESVLCVRVLFRTRRNNWADVVLCLGGLQFFFSQVDPH